MGPGLSSKPSTTCFRGCAICLPTASITAPTCARPLPNLATGQSRPSRAPPGLLAFNSSRADDAVRDDCRYVYPAAFGAAGPPTPTMLLVYPQATPSNDSKGLNSSKEPGCIDKGDFRSWRWAT